MTHRPYYNRLIQKDCCEECGGDWPCWESAHPAVGIVVNDLSAAPDSEFEAMLARVEAADEVGVRDLIADAIADKLRAVALMAAHVHPEEGWCLPTYRLNDIADGYDAIQRDGAR